MLIISGVSPLTRILLTIRWVFSAIVATTRQLRLRRNLVKLSVYKHFANTLVFSIINSIVFMLWSIKYHRTVECLTQWRDLWVDEVSSGGGVGSY